jgi:hypothetical protein
MSIYTKEFIQEKIVTDTRWTIRTLEVIFNRQTTDEQVNQQTSHKNGRGFTGIDGELLSSFHSQVQKNRLQNRLDLLSEKQMNICKKKLPKYWKQVKEEIEEKQGV